MSSDTKQQNAGFFFGREYNIKSTNVDHQYSNIVNGICT